MRKAKSILKNNVWRIIHLDVAPRDLLSRVAARAYRVLNPELSVDEILDYGCFSGSYSKHQLIVLCTQMLKLIDLRRLSYAGFPKVPHIPVRVPVESIDRILN